MVDFKTIILETPKEVCATLHDLTDPSRVAFKKGQLDALNDFFHRHGFPDVEYVGNGSNAVVIAPKDNRDFVIRIDKFHGDHRGEIPYMVQPIGQPIRVATYHAEGKEWGGYRVEFVKRLDMKVAPDALHEFLHQIEKDGYGADSLARGSEIGWYHFTDADGHEKKGADGSRP